MAVFPTCVYFPRYGISHLKALIKQIVVFNSVVTIRVFPQNVCTCTGVSAARLLVSTARRSFPGTAHSSSGAWTTCCWLTRAAACLSSDWNTAQSVRPSVSPPHCRQTVVTLLGCLAENSGQNLRREIATVPEFMASQNEHGFYIDKLDKQQISKFASAIKILSAHSFTQTWLQ